MAEENYKHSEVTEQVIKAYYNVYNALGYGFLEKVYENALVIELLSMGLAAIPQKPITVFYKGREIGLYYADILINDCVIVELKSAQNIAEEHEAQLLNYLKATNIEVGLLLNFGKQAQFKKKVFSNGFKV
jgi:GxxExxY protein